MCSSIKSPIDPSAVVFESQPDIDGSRMRLERPFGPVHGAGSDAVAYIAYVLASPYGTFLTYDDADRLIEELSRLILDADNAADEAARLARERHARTLAEEQRLHRL